MFAVLIYAQVYTYILRAFGIDGYAGHIAYFAGLLVSYFHMMCVFMYGDTAARKRFFACGRKIFRSAEFWLANSVFFSMTLAFAPEFALFHITSVFFQGQTFSFDVKKIIITFIMLFINFGLIFLSLYFIRAKWKSEGEESDDFRGAGKIFLRVFAAFLFYRFLLGVVIRFTVTMVFYTGLFFNIFVFAIPIIIVFSVLYAFFSLLKRRRIEKKIKDLCKRKGFVFFARTHGVLCVEARGKLYAVKVLGAVKIIINLYFLLSRNKFLKKFSENTLGRFTFCAESGERNIFVLFHVSGKSQTGRFAENGDYFGNHRIFYINPFLRALENDFLER
jgi:hypothetical protein